MRYVVFFLCCCCFLNSKVVEINNIAEMAQHVEDGFLLVFDIDNTIMEPTQTLGSDQWFYHRIDEYAEKGYSSQEALEMALAEWMAVQNVTKVKMVEPSVAGLIETFQKEGRPLIGLTTRGLGLATRTIEQLETLDIDLSKTSPIQGDQYVENKGGVLFRNGILFTAGTNKGTAFFKLLEKVGYAAKKVLFVNDKTAHLLEVERACKRKKVGFLGLRYGFLDQKVKNMRKDLAKIQWEHFGKLLSDHDAEKALVR